MRRDPVILRMTRRVGHPKEPQQPGTVQVGRRICGGGRTAHHRLLLPITGFTGSADATIRIPYEEKGGKVWESIVYIRRHDP